MKNPLLDYNFLHQLDNERNKIVYAKITSLTLNNLPVESIEGVMTGGSISIDGSSAVRRICNLTMTTKNFNLNNIYWALTTRIKVEVGLANSINKEYPDIIWFPQGIFILTDFKTSNQVNNYTITLSAKDKMCLLNGDVGGNFNSETDCGSYDYQKEDGTWVNVKLGIGSIIRNLVKEYAQENEENIIVKDIDYGLEMLKNNSLDNIYLIETVKGEEIVDVIYKKEIKKTLPASTLDIYQQTGIDIVETSIRKYDINEDGSERKHNHTYYYSDHETQDKVKFDELPENFVFKPTSNEDDIGLLAINSEDIATNIYYLDDKKQQVNCLILKIAPGDDIGYKMINMFYPGELIAAPGETVVSILDKIVKTFCGYEYFFDINGRFVFQAKESYVNTAWNAIIRRDDETYIDPSQVSSYVQYSFEGSKLTTAYQNAPNMGNVKNDYTVWGEKPTDSGKGIPIHMRYAIDRKPSFYRNFEHKVFMTSDFYKTWDTTLETKLETHKSYDNEISFAQTEKLLWWTIQDWKNYYEEKTGAYPVEKLMAYQNDINEGFTGRLYFSTKSMGNIIIATEKQPENLEDREPNVIYVGSEPIFILDIITSDNIPVDREGNPVTLNTEYTAETFGYRINECTENYTEIMDHNNKNINKITSYLYNPKLPINKNILSNTDFIDPSSIQVVDWREIIYQMAKDYYAYNRLNEFHLQLHKNNIIPSHNIDLYMHGKTGYEPYYHDIEAFWRSLYCPPYDQTDRIFNSQRNYGITGKDSYYNAANAPRSRETQEPLYLFWNKKIIEDPSTLCFWFDFLNADAPGLEAFSAPAIGNRPKVVNNDKVKAIIYKGIPNVIFYDGSDNEKNILSGYHYYDASEFINYSETDTIVVDLNDGKGETTISNYKFELFTRSTKSLTAQEEIDDLIYNFSYCNETITINTIPIYYLNPNTIISAKDEQHVVNGYYIMNKINLPLTYNGTTTINAIKVPERIY